MTETNLYKRITSTLSRYGTTIRIENVSGASVPDMVWLTRGETIWLEAKIQVGHRVMFNKFQLSIARRALQHLHDWQWLCVVQNADLLHVHKFAPIFDAQPTSSKNSKIVAINIATLEPWCSLAELPSLVMSKVHGTSEGKAELQDGGAW